MDMIIGLAVLIILLLLYFLPTYVASKRNHKNTTPIFVLNLFLGWSFVIWVIVLAWAFIDGESDE